MLGDTKILRCVIKNLTLGGYYEINAFKLSYLFVPAQYMQKPKSRTKLLENPFRPKSLLTMRERIMNLKQQAFLRVKS